MNNVLWGNRIGWSIIILIITMSFSACKSESDAKDEKSSGLSSEYLGNYQGVQESHFMKNKYGDDMIINGTKIRVPSSEHKFLLDKDNIASLQQTNLDTYEKYYYTGGYKVISDNSEVIKVEIKVTDGAGSSPTYIFEINKSEKSGNCIQEGYPTFKVSKIN